MADENKSSTVEVPVSDLRKAIQLVGLLMNDLNIPGSKAADWAAAGRVLVDLSAFLDASEANAVAKAKVAAPADDAANASDDAATPAQS